MFFDFIIKNLMQARSQDLPAQEPSFVTNQSELMANEHPWQKGFAT